MHKSLLFALIVIALFSSYPVKAETYLGDFFLDSRSPSAAAGPFLTQGRVYRIVIDGTYTLWWNQDWAPGPFGSPESAARYPSPGQSDDRMIGCDPLYCFARPDQRHTVPHKAWNVKFSTGGGLQSPHDIETFAYDIQHSYSFLVSGEDAFLTARFDDTYLLDNFGQIRFQVYIQDLPPTHVPTATVTPTASPSPTPSPSPQPSVTPTPSPFPTNTPLIPSKVGLWLNSTYVSETLSLDLRVVWARPAESPELALIIAAEIGGGFYYYPSFDLTPEFFFEGTLPPTFDTSVLRLFEVPIQRPSVPLPMTWYGAFFNNGVYNSEFGIAESSVLLW